MKSEAKNIYSFFKENVLLSIYTFFLTIIVYGIKIFHLSYGMDTNRYIVKHNQYLNHWVGIGRFGEVLIKKILWGSYTNIYLLNILAFTLFALSSLLICYMITKSIEIKKIKYHLLIIPSIFLTSQIFVYQFYFVLQNFEFALGIFLVVIASLLIQKEYQSNRSKVLGYLLAILLLVLCFGIYQSFMLLFIGLSAAILMLIIYNRYTIKQNMKFIELVKLATPYIIVFVISAILYFIANELVLNILDIEKKQHAMGMMIWHSLPLKESLVSLMKSLIKVIFFPYNGNQYRVYNYVILLSIVISFLIILKLIKSRVRIVLPFIVSLIVLFFSALGIIIATGTIPVPRSMVPQYPFVASFLIFYGSLYFNRGAIKKLLLTMVIILTFNQIKTASNLLFSEQMTFEEDQRKMIKIDQKISDLGLNNQYSYRLILVGTSPATNKFNTTTYNELVGLSMFQFGESPDVASYNITDNILSLMEIMGFYYERPSVEEYMKYYKENIDMMDSEEAFEIRVVDNFIVVKLS